MQKFKTAQKKNLKNIPKRSRIYSRSNHWKHSHQIIQRLSFATILFILPIVITLHVFRSPLSLRAQLSGTVEYDDCIPETRPNKESPVSDFKIHVMMRSQSPSFEKFGVPPH